MTTRPHQPLRDYIEAVKGTIERSDPFGQHLIALVYRRRRVEASGIFRRVRAVHDAVGALGGSLDNSRTWTLQSIRWCKSGKAVDQKYAPYEIDVHASAAMNDLLDLVLSLPDDLLRPDGALPFPFGGKPAANQAPTNSPFGSKPAPSQPSNSPFGARPSPTPPQPSNSPFSKPPTPPKPSPFGARPSPFAAPEITLPTFVAACFDALAAVTLSAAADLSWLEELAASGSSNPPPKAAADLPSDLKGLFERLVGADNDEEIATEILRKIGALNDPHALDFVYNVTSGTGREGDLAPVFEKMGGDVGVAGLLTLLPVAAERRADWLKALTGVIAYSMSSGQPLSETSLEAAWKIALAENAPNVAWNAAAFDLLAAFRRTESLPILWEHARAADTDERRAALDSLIKLDPGIRFYELLAALTELAALPSAALPASLPRQMEIGIPFERLAAIVRAPFCEISVSALYLLGYIDDPRTVPLLIKQLSRRDQPMCERALSHLHRLNAQSAADAITRLMEKNPALRHRAAVTLCEWGDARCVPALLELAGPLKGVPDLDQLTRQVGKLPHPAFIDWLLCDPDLALPALSKELEDRLIKVIEILAEIKSELLQPLLEKLIGSPSARVRGAVALALSTLDNGWAHDSLRTLAADPAPSVSYAAVGGLHDSAFGRELSASHAEVERVLAVRILWNAKDAEALIGCLADASAAVRTLAITALGALHAAAAVPDLHRLIAQQDRLDVWGQNPAVLAWRTLARMDALTPAPA